MPDTAITSTTQQFLDIYDITNDIVIMKDGSTSLIISVDALNFGLLAEEEQDAIIYSYASLLNSINYPIQILIKSQTKDVTKYLGLLEEEADKTTSKLKRHQINQYRNFVGELIQERNVLDKKFYVVIPANALEMGVVSAQSVIPGVKSSQIETFEKSYILEKAKNSLDPKRDHLISQFGRIGLYARQLTTQEIIQLFYTSYNPEAAEGQNLTDSKNYTTPLVKASVQGEFMADATTTPTPNTTPTPEEIVAASIGETPQPVTPVQDPAQTAPTTPVAPAVTPEPAPAEVQSEINSTLQQIGSAPTPTAPVAGESSGVNVPPVQPTTPTTNPTQPTGPVTPVTPMTPVQPINPTPVVTPVTTPTPPAQQPVGEANTGADMQPLPEI